MTRKTKSVETKNGIITVAEFRENNSFLLHLVTQQHTNTLWVSLDELKEISIELANFVVEYEKK